MSCTRGVILFAPAALILAGCSGELTLPNDATGSSGASSAASLSPNRNLEVVLRPVGAGAGFGLVKFRQPKDEGAIVFLDVWVRDLLPNTSFRLQRANDATVDDMCTGTNWLTLGQGAAARNIVTDERGTGREDLFRDLSAFVGSAFDIHFRVIDEGGVVVLQSECYQFVVAL
jgi:hypothetical protein